LLRTSGALRVAAALAAALMYLGVARAGPPYVTDDPEPTDQGHYEVYFFGQGENARDSSGGSAGVDFNYGAVRNLQLTAVVPLSWSSTNSAPTQSGLGNVELAAKYRFLQQQSAGADLAFFPRVFLPAGSAAVGERHAQLFLPFWVQRSGQQWAVFGGGGCTLNHGSEGRNYCQVGAAVTDQVSSRLQVGAELYHQSAATQGAPASTGAGFGATYDVSEHWHLMFSAGPGLQNPQETGRAMWYVAMLMTL
jgi:hypothetical protein